MSIRKKEIVAGIFLIGIGLLVFLAQFGTLPNLGLFFLPALGAVFLVWGILTREDGLMIPGGILSGIGWGVVAMSADLAVMNEANEGGIFLMIFGLGFASITLLTAVFTDETHWWALIPGAILATIGIAVTTNGFLLDVVELAGTYWPAILIILGVYVIFKAMSGNEADDKYEKVLEDSK